MSQVLVYFVLSLPLVGAYSLLALGIVVIFRASKVLNLAHGAMAMWPAYILYEASRRHVPLPAALVLGLVCGGAIGWATDYVFIRSLRRQSATGQTVGTVAVFGLLIAVAAKIWGTQPRVPVDVFPSGGIHVGASLLRYGQIGLFCVAIVGCLGLFALFSHTDFGLAMKATAQNRRAASLMGIDPDATTSIAWIMGGALAALAGMMLAAVTALHPYTLSLQVLPAFVAALIGGLDRPANALIGAAVVGLTQGMVPAIGLLPVARSFASQVGAPELAITVLAFVVMIVRGERFTGAGSSSEAS
jgi:branched-subunit amino acid ABC-type transport system permease component